jgi:predicted nucleic-acid-binding Zn-ribbon protein
MLVRRLSTRSSPRRTKAGSPNVMRAKVEANGPKLNKKLKIKYQKYCTMTVF